MLPTNTSLKSTVLKSNAPRVPAELLPTIDRDASLLDLGCGWRDGALLQTLQMGGDIPQIVRADYFLTNLKWHRSDGPKVQADATRLPFMDGVFGTVLTSEVTADNAYFDEIPLPNADPKNLEAAAQNRNHMAAEIARVLRPGGLYLAYHELHTGRPVPGMTTMHEMLQYGVHPSGVAVTGLVLGVYQKAV